MTKLITQEEYDQHDCHQSPDDSCKACDQWFSQELAEESTDDFIKLGWKCYQLGYYNINDFVALCSKNDTVVTIGDVYDLR